MGGGTPGINIPPDFSYSSIKKYLFEHYKFFRNPKEIKNYYFKGCLFVALISILIYFSQFFLAYYKKITAKRYLLLCDVAFFLFFSILIIIPLFFGSFIYYLDVWLIIFLIVFRCFQYYLLNIIK